MIALTLPCGCSLTASIESPDGNWLKDRPGDTLQMAMTRCKEHDAGPKIIASCREALEVLEWGRIHNQTGPPECSRCVDAMIDTFEWILGGNGGDSVDELLIELKRTMSEAN